MDAGRLIEVAKPGQERALALSLAHVGVPTLIVEPGSKSPLDLRPIQMRLADDEAAAVAAKAALDPRWADVRSKGGVHLGTTDMGRLEAYFDTFSRRYSGMIPNLAIRLTGQDLIVVDADNAADVQRFQTTYQAVTGHPIHPTVLTPGVVASGVWRHRGGAHFYLTLPPNHELPLTDWSHPTDGWTVMVRDRYVLIPPSTRPEGSYVWTGAGTVACPDELMAVLDQEVQKDTARAASREAARTAFANGQVRDVDVWSASVSWDALLTQDGWTPYKSASCGCPLWTGPGGHTNPDSACSHDWGCSASRIDTSRGHGPLVIYTTRIPEVVRPYCEKNGVRSLTKLQYLAASWNMPIGWVCKRLGMVRPPI